MTLDEGVGVSDNSLCLVRRRKWKFEKSLSSLFSVINYVLFFQRANSISTFFSAADVFMYSSKAVTAAFSVCIMKPKMRTPAK